MNLKRTFVVSGIVGLILMILLVVGGVIWTLRQDDSDHSEKRSTPSPRAYHLPEEVDQVQTQHPGRGSQRPRRGDSESTAVATNRTGKEKGDDCARRLRERVVVTGDVSQHVEEAFVRSFEESIQQLEDTGKLSAEQLFRMREEARLSKLNVPMATLADWLAAYNGQVHAEPIQIDIEADAPYRFATPEQVVAAYWRAQFRGDVEALFNMSDESARAMLRRHFSLKRGEKMPYAFDGATQICILMQGELKIDKERYVLLYLRRTSKDADEGMFSIQSSIAREVDGRYMITELPRSSAFADIAGVTAIKFYPYGPYKKLLPKLKNSALPISFYTLGESGVIH